VIASIMRFAGPVLQHPVFRAIVGVALLTCMDAVMKGQMRSHPLVQAIFMRFACGALIIAFVVLWVRPPRPTAASIKANLVRVPIALMTTISFFFSVSVLPLAEALTFAFLSPLFVALFGIILLREHVDRRIWVALGFGLAGMLVMVWPRLGEQSSRDTLGIAGALFAAVTYAFNLVLLRRLALHEHPVTIVAFQNTGPALVLAIPALIVWTPLGAADLALFLLAGILAVCGLLLITSAFASAKAARLAAVDYTALIWAAGLGWLFFGEIPGLNTWAGAMLIIAGALVVSRR
jgi:drug/metabolite transporter (DMT)-like permease